MRAEKCMHANMHIFLYDIQKLQIAYDTLNVLFSCLGNKQMHF